MPYLFLYRFIYGWGGCCFVQMYDFIPDETSVMDEIYIFAYPSCFLSADYSSVCSRIKDQWRPPMMLTASGLGQIVEKYWINKWKNTWPSLRCGLHKQIFQIVFFFLSKYERKKFCRFHWFDFDNAYSFQRKYLSHQHKSDIYEFKRYRKRSSLVGNGWDAGRLAYEELGMIHHALKLDSEGST